MELSFGTIMVPPHNQIRRDLGGKGPLDLHIMIACEKV